MKEAENRFSTPNRKTGVTVLADDGKTGSNELDHGQRIHSILKSIYYLSSFGLLEEAREALSAFDQNDDYWEHLTDGHYIFQFFLHAKIEFAEYKKTSLLSHLEKAQRHLEEMMNYASDAVRLRNPKYLILRIHVAHHLSLESNDEKRRGKFAHAAAHLAGVGLDKYPQIAAFEHIYYMVIGEQMHPSIIED